MHRTRGLGRDKVTRANPGKRHEVRLPGNRAAKLYATAEVVGCTAIRRRFRIRQHFTRQDVSGFPLFRVRRCHDGTAAQAWTTGALDLRPDPVALARRTISMAPWRLG